MKPSISVIICTHNPSRDYLNRVLMALRNQTLSTQLWELLIVDNASNSLLSVEIDLNWHPNSHHIRENELGLTSARIRGIEESRGDILVFVDDDNVLDKQYLECVLKISDQWSIIGAWGGKIEPEFETMPEEWTKPYWGDLAIRTFEHDKWSNQGYGNDALPCGSGLCVRKNIAQKYVNLVQQDPIRLSLDRRGNSLSSCGDSDLALTACDLDFGVGGNFTCLKLTHLISNQRIQESYLLKLSEGIARSITILKFLRTGIILPPKS